MDQLEVTEWSLNMARFINSILKGERAPSRKLRKYKHGYIFTSSIGSPFSIFRRFNFKGWKEILKRDIENEM